MTGPKLTQRKIAKLHEALLIVVECVDGEDPTSVTIRKAMASALSACMVLEVVLGERKVENVRSERV